VWLAGVALVTASPGLCARPALALDGIPAVLGPDRFRLAVPAPPSPPGPPTLEAGLDAGDPWTEAWPDAWYDALSADPAGEEAADESEETGALEAFSEEEAVTLRNERTVSVPPGLPVPTYPIVITPPVEALIDYFVDKERDRFGTWIARSGRYLPLIRQVFREHGLPEELAYTAMIESGFSPRAVSRVGAKGMWQFMEATGRRYGLVVNRWVDERLDPVKSTIAAARYLADLYGMFGHWFLAQAGYNAGEARVARAIKRANTSDFWALSQTRHLPEETKLFVPQILAAAVITREPARYGFDVTLEDPLAFDEVPLRRALDLDTIARLAEVSVEAIRDLNPALLARITPPFGTYALRLPVGVGARFEAALQEAPPSSLPSWKVHRVARNQSLAEVARMYRLTPTRLAELNHLRGGLLRGVRELVVPAVSRPVPVKVAPATTADARVVVVRRGDTLSTIAARHRTTVRVLAQLNGLDPRHPLRIGTRLRVTP
jgi:membrane-bound lytic murein transglycosylase D